MSDANRDVRVAESGALHVNRSGHRLLCAGLGPSIPVTTV
jgi:hypothetical protein